MQGDQSKALIILSKAKGWDPTRIYPNGPSIENFDMPPTVITNQARTGKLPQGVPDVFPDSIYEAKATMTNESFSTPAATEETKSRRSKNASPYDGFDGGY